MSAAKDRMLKLMAYADGELEGRELAEVEAWLATDPKAARFASELANLGDLVKSAHQESVEAKAIESFDIADAVLAEVQRNPTRDPAERPGDVGGVVALDRARRRKTLQLGAVAFAALALAASVFLFTRTKSEEPLARGPASVQPSPSAPSGNDPGVDVDVTETPGQSVSVFYLPNESSLATSVVVWVDETGSH